mgnify:CR=1 FL=1
MKNGSIDIVRKARLALAEAVLSEALGGPILKGMLPRASKPGPNAGMRAQQEKEFRKFLKNRNYESAKDGYELPSEAPPGQGHRTPKRGSTSS